MARYLVVADQTASSSELADALMEKRHADPKAEFVLLRPQTSLRHVLPHFRERHKEIGVALAEDAARALARTGTNISRVVSAEESPLKALETELMQHAGEYDELIISTFPIGISRWLKLDLLDQARKFALPITHVVADPSIEEKPLGVSEVRDRSSSRPDASGPMS